MNSDIKPNDPASLWRRLAAMSYDGLLAIALWFLIEMIAVGINHGQAITASQIPFVQTAVFISLFIFFAWFWMHGGQTLGMRAWRLHLVSQTDKPIRLPQCLLRFLVAFISAGCLGLGFLWMLWDKDKLTWHDRYSMTRVIYIKK